MSETESEVLQQHAPTMLRPPFVIIQFVGTASTDRKSLRLWERTGKGSPLPKMYKGLIRLDRFETVWLPSIQWLELSLLTFLEKGGSRTQCFFSPRQQK